MWCPTGSNDTITAWWSLWQHYVQFPLIVLLIFSRTGTHFLYKPPKYCYTIKKYSSQAHLSHSVICMRRRLQGLMWFECCEISKEEPLLWFMFNGSIVTCNSYLKKSSNTYCKLLSYFFHLFFIFQLQPVQNFCKLFSIHFT